MIVGGGFAGVWASIGAAAVLGGAGGDISVVLVSPDGMLVVRPRLYEADLSGVRVPLGVVLSPLGVLERRATVCAIDVDRRVLSLSGRDAGELGYDQLVLCAGSRVRPHEEMEGVHGVDSYAQAVRLHRTLEELSARRDEPLSATVVGGGFTGIELACELAGMLAGSGPQYAGEPRRARVSLIERAPVVAPEFGAAAREVIEEALRSLGVQAHPGTAVSGVDRGGVQLAGGGRLDSDIVVWTGGPRASGLNEQLGVSLDRCGRVVVDSHMASEVEGVWAAGDCASVSVDGRHAAMMSCQHAMPQGRQAGANAAAALLGRPLGRYTQPLYLTCLDLGAAGALLTSGFERDTILARGGQAKRFKRFVNRSLIYPPLNGSAAELLKLGRSAPPGRIAAAIQRTALRAGTVRGLVSSRSEDRAARCATLELQQ